MSRSTGFSMSFPSITTKPVSASSKVTDRWNNPPICVVVGLPRIGGMTTHPQQPLE